MLLEIPDAEREGDSYSPGLPGMDIFKRAHRQLTFHMLSATCRSFWAKLRRITCCACKVHRPARYMHRSDRDYELGCYYWVQDRVAYRVVRGDRTRSSWISEKEGSLQFGNLDRVGEGFWEPWTPFNYVSDTVVYDPCVGCSTCNDKWKKHPWCWYCKLNGGRIRKKLPRLARRFNAERPP